MKIWQKLVEFILYMLEVKIRFYHSSCTHWIRERTHTILYRLKFLSKLFKTFPYIKRNVIVFVGNKPSRVMFCSEDMNILSLLPAIVIARFIYSKQSD